jgi:hypothetical protein
LVATLNAVQYHSNALWLWNRARSVWLNALGVGPVLLLFALLPSVSYVDHWGEFASNATETRAAEQDDRDPHSPGGEHAAHCHSSVASCAEQPAPADLRQLQVVIDVREPVLLETVLDHAQHTMAGFVSAIPSEPPRLAA